MKQYAYDYFNQDGGYEVWYKTPLQKSEKYKHFDTLEDAEKWVKAHKKTAVATRGSWQVLEFLEGREMEKINVIFRKDNSGNIIAFFPEMACNYGKIMCYAHIGQHSEADIFFYMCDTKPAKQSEYDELLKEIKSIYSACNVCVKKRLPKGGNSCAWKN